MRTWKQAHYQPTASILGFSNVSAPVLKDPLVCVTSLQVVTRPGARLLPSPPPSMADPLQMNMKAWGGGFEVSKALVLISGGKRGSPATPQRYEKNMATPSSDGQPSHSTPPWLSAQAHPVSCKPTHGDKKNCSELFFFSSTTTYLPCLFVACLPQKKVRSSLSVLQHLGQYLTHKGPQHIVYWMNKWMNESLIKKKRKERIAQRGELTQPSPLMAVHSVPLSFTQEESNLDRYPKDKVHVTH